MPITAWKPATQISRGNIVVGIAPALTDINAPKLTELTATGTTLECAIQTFNGTSSGYVGAGSSATARWGRRTAPGSSAPPSESNFHTVKVPMPAS